MQGFFMLAVFEWACAWIDRLLSYLVYSVIKKKQLCAFVLHLINLNFFKDRRYDWIMIDKLDASWIVRKLNYIETHL